MVRKGQMFTTDFLASVIVFMSLISVAFLTVNNTVRRQTQFQEYQVMNRRAFQISNMWTRTPGYPADWNTSTVKIIGLAKPDHLLQEEKMDMLSDINYSRVKNIMDLGRYDFFANVTTNNGTEIESWGLKPVDPQELAVQTRSVIVNLTNSTKRGKLKFMLWKNETE